MTQPGFSYTRKDYNTIKVSVERYLRAKFPTTWKNVYESDVGVMWMEIIAYAFDQLSYFVDKQALETYIPTAQDRESLTNIVKLVGYQPRNPTAASTLVKFTLPALDSYNVVVPAGTVFNAAGGVPFEALSDIIIPAGQTTGYGVVTAGQTTYKDFTADGSKFQRILVTDSNWINGSITVTVNGVDWVVTDSLLNGDASSKIFTIDVAANQNFYVCFADGVSGAMPANGATVRITYRTGGGISGNIGVGEINQTVLAYRDGTFPVENISIAAYNDDTGSGGEDAEDIEDIRLWGPKWARTNARAVTAEDFDTLAAKFNDPVHGSPARAKSMLHQEVPELNLVDIYLWSRDSEGKFTKPSTSLKAAVQNYFDNNGPGAVRLMCVDTQVLDGIIVYVKLAITVTIVSTAKSDTVSTNISTALGTLFDSVFNQPGTSVRISKIYETVMGVSGVKYCIIDKAAGVVEYDEELAPVGSTQQIWTGVLGSVPLWGIYPGEIEFTDGLQVVRDDGNGHLTGNVDNTYTNVVKYVDKSYLGVYVGPAGLDHYTYTVTDTPIIPGSVKIYSDNFTIFDIGGKLVGTGIASSPASTIDYNTGAIDLYLDGAYIPTGAVRLSYYKLERGTYDFKFASAPTGSDAITAKFKSIASYYKEENMGVGDGATKTFDYVLKNPPTFRKSVVISDSGNIKNTEIRNGDGGQAYSITLSSFPIPGTLVLSSGSQFVYDTGYGQLTGDIDPAGNNNIDYGSGEISVTFRDPVPVGTGNIMAQYNIPSNLVVYDDGYGILMGVVDPTKDSSIDYYRGALSVSFQSAPYVGNIINVHYLSLLNSPSEDMYISNKQLASLETVAISIVRESNAN